MNALKEQIFLAAENELADALDQQLEQRRRQRRTQALIASGLLLSSLVGAMAGNTYGQIQARPLTVAEAEAIMSLMDYVALRMNASRDWVEDVLLAHFDVGGLNQIKASQYDEVIEYLVHIVH